MSRSDGGRADHVDAPHPPTGESHAPGRKRAKCWEPDIGSSASLADVFDNEARRNGVMTFGANRATPSLDWLLLTKRPNSVKGMVPWGDDWPANVWLGKSVENRQLRTQRLPALLSSGRCSVHLCRAATVYVVIPEGITGLLWAARAAPG